MHAGIVAQPHVNAKSAIMGHAMPEMRSSVVKPERHSRRISEVIEMAKVIRRHGDLLTPQAFQIVMEIALEPGITMQSLETRTGLSHASISRNLSSLGPWHRLGKPGLDLVEKAQDPVESRRQIAFLTTKGRLFVEEILSAGRHAEDRVSLDAPTAKEFVTRTHRSHR